MPPLLVREQRVLRLAVARAARGRSRAAPAAARAAFGPSTWNWPMWETSKTPRSRRTARCSGITPSYWTGISQPANGTMRAPSGDVAFVQRRPSQSRYGDVHGRDSTRCAWPEHRERSPRRLRRSRPRAGVGPPRRVRCGDRSTSLSLLAGSSGSRSPRRSVVGRSTTRALDAAGAGHRGRGLDAAAARPAAEAGRDHGHAHLVAHRLVDHGAEDDVRVRVGVTRDDLGRLVDLEQAEVGAAR